MTIFNRFLDSLRSLEMTGRVEIATALRSHNDERSSPRWDSIRRISQGKSYGVNVGLNIKENLAVFISVDRISLSVVRRSYVVSRALRPTASATD